MASVEKHVQRMIQGIRSCVCIYKPVWGMIAFM